MLRIKTAPFLFRNSTPKYFAESYHVSHHYGIALLNITDDKTIIISEVNEDFLQLTAQDKKNLNEINLCETSIWNDHGQLWEAICECLGNHKTQVINWNFMVEDTHHSINCSIVPTFAQENKPSSLTLIISNNSADIAFADQINKFNYYDKLTGLPNQNFLNEKTDFIFSGNYLNAEVAVLLINLVNFQRINESFGYELGDEIIKEVANKLERHLPKNSILARFDGDKFAILMRDDDAGTMKCEAQALALSIHHAMTRAIFTNEQKIYLTLTIGIAVGSTPLNDSSKLIQDAHIALQRLNITSQEKTLVYQPELQTHANSQMNLEHDLREALRNKDFSLKYQPIVSLQNGELIGFEALSRWNHPTRGIISPIEFIPLAEKTGLIIPLGNWVLREACKSLKAWVDKYPNCSNLVMNVNVSGLQLLQDGFVATTQESLFNAGLRGSQLALEITETTLAENAEIVRGILLDLKSLDIGLAIDDFGTGYSYLSYLNQFPVDTLKIDKSFVNRMNSTEDSYKIISIISTLAQTLGLNLVAEGIEIEEHLVGLKNLGCQNGQGFLFSKPLSLEEAEKYICLEPTSLV